MRSETHAAARFAPVRRWTRREALQGALSLSLFGLGAIPSMARATSLRVGQPAPQATVVDLNGTHWNTQDLRGRLVILTFWATWCVPCRKELPLLSAYAAQHAAQGLNVLGFSLDDTDQIDAVRKIAKSLSFPVGLLAENSAPGYGRMWRIPVNFTIDRDGRLIDNGWDDKQPIWTQERLERIVTPLLSGAPSVEQGPRVP